MFGVGGNQKSARVSAGLQESAWSTLKKTQSVRRRLPVPVPPLRRPSFRRAPIPWLLHATARTRDGSIASSLQALPTCVRPSRSVVPTCMHRLVEDRIQRFCAPSAGEAHLNWAAWPPAAPSQIRWLESDDESRSPTCAQMISVTVHRRRRRRNPGSAHGISLACFPLPRRLERDILLVGLRCMGHGRSSLRSCLP